ncbi:hypothetical protein [Ensifer aridi]|uniref:hypothetical protein n=1 Tax=Ensifer aridi TaxID=1708715 RepID=UPI0015E31CEC|nr:hypothetical protein [Ensifer aridi]
MTTSLVLKPDQARLLKEIAATRMMRGEMPTASVSEVIRRLINENEKAFRAEIAGGKTE